jgi:hypothetical protein
LLCNYASSSARRASTCGVCTGRMSFVRVSLLHAPLTSWNDDTLAGEERQPRSNLCAGGSSAVHLSEQRPYTKTCPRAQRPASSLWPARPARIWMLHRCSRARASVEVRRDRGAGLPRDDSQSLPPSDSAVDSRWSARTSAELSAARKEATVRPAPVSLSALTYVFCLPGSGAATSPAPSSRCCPRTVTSVTLSRQCGHVSRP